MADTPHSGGRLLKLQDSFFSGFVIMEKLLRSEPVLVIVRPYFNAD